MKPKRTLEEATRIYKLANTDKKYSNWLDSLVGTVEESASRFDSIGMQSRYIGLISSLGKLNPIVQEILLPSLMNTCIDVGTCIGRIMYEETLPDGLEEKGNVYVN